MCLDGLADTVRGDIALQHHERFRLQKPVIVGSRNNGGLDNVIMRDYLLFDLEGRDPDPRNLEHIVGAPAIN